MTKSELLAKIQEICPEAFIHEGESGTSEIFIATGLVEPEEDAELVSIEELNEVSSTITDRTVHYFATDGNYGDVSGLVIVETTQWTELDWEDFEAASDESRPMTAETIAKKYKK